MVHRVGSPTGRMTRFLGSTRYVARRHPDRAIERSPRSRHSGRGWRGEIRLQRMNLRKAIHEGTNSLPNTRRYWAYHMRQHRLSVARCLQERVILDQCASQPPTDRRTVNGPVRALEDGLAYHLHFLRYGRLIRSHLISSIVRLGSRKRVNTACCCTSRDGE